MSVLAALTLAAASAGISPNLLIAVCTTESNLNALSINVDDRGGPSRGLCQIKLSTARWLGFKVTATDLYKADINARIAARYLSYLLHRYHGKWEWAVAAYNHGHLCIRGGRIINQSYVNKVKGLL